MGPSEATGGEGMTAAMVAATPGRSDLGSVLAALAPELDAAAGYAGQARAANTLRAYASDLRSFAAWCSARGVVAVPAHRSEALPPEARTLAGDASAAIVASYLGALADAGRTVATIRRALSSIAQAFKGAGVDSPASHRVVRETTAGIVRTLGAAPRVKAPFLPEALRAAARAPATGRSDLGALRDRALLAVGFAGGFRRSALVALDVADLVFCAEGVKVTIRRDKTDQEGLGRTIGLPLASAPEACPVRTLRAWLDAAKIDAGPVFRAVDKSGRASAARLSDRAVALVVKGAATRAGLDASTVAGHSLRAGFATAAARAGKSDRAIMRTTGHRSRAMVDRYVREAELFADNAGAGLV